MPLRGENVLLRGNEWLEARSHQMTIHRPQNNTSVWALTWGLYYSGWGLHMGEGGIFFPLSYALFHSGWAVWEGFHLSFLCFSMPFCPWCLNTVPDMLLSVLFYAAFWTFRGGHRGRKRIQSYFIWGHNLQLKFTAAQET